MMIIAANAVQIAQKMLSPVEILGRMNFFQEFWVEPEKHAWQMLVILMAFILLGVYLWLKGKQRKRVEQ